MHQKVLNFVYYLIKIALFREINTNFAPGNQNFKFKS